MVNLNFSKITLEQKSRRSPFLSVCALSLLTLQGCETTNTGTGFVQGRNGSASDTVSFYVINSTESNASTVEARFSSGDVYTGKFIAATSESRRADSTFEINIGDDDDETSLAPSTTYLSKAKGVLFTESGKSMQCTMTLATPSSGFDGGAVGKCKTSSGDIIPMQLNEAD